MIHIGGNATVHVGDQYSPCLQHSSSGLTAGALEKYDSLAKSLLFDRIDFRVNNVKKALLSTREWLFRHPDFSRWYENDPSSGYSGSLWIKGKLGCRKSTKEKLGLVDSFTFLLNSNARASQSLFIRELNIDFQG